MKKLLEKTVGQASPKMRMIATMVAGALLIATVTGLIGVRQWYRNSLQPRDTTASVQSFVVETGLSALSIGDDLEEAGLIRSSTAFGWYVDRENVRDRLQAGTYELSASQTIPEIVDKLVNGEVATNIVTILPGYRLDQVEDQMVAAGFKRSQVQAALGDDYDHDILKNKPGSASLEGYVFPDTYQIGKATSARSLILRTFDNFDARLNSRIRGGLVHQHLSLHDAITLASIVQQETDDPKDQPLVAQVFLRRLRIGMALGSDVTYMYAAALTGQVATPDLDSLYNTRKYAGLPPGPIGNFNLSALKAVAFPADTDYLYFVAGDDGVVHFSRTLEEHENLTQKYCTKLCN